MTESTEPGKPPQLPVKRTRIGRPKTKTGCITCKIRHVKCDEAKPECERCTSTGRKCDGYITPVPRAQKAVPSSITPLETEALQYFRLVTAPGLSSYFDGDFWMQLVPQMAASEPAIRLAAAAIGAWDRDNASGQSTQSATALYNKAISTMTKSASNGEPTPTMLVGCVLFICFEFLRQNIKNAFKHLKGGVGIAMLGDTSSPGSESSRASSNTEGGIAERAMQFLYRVESLSTCFDASVVPEAPQQLTMPPEFHSVAQARACVTHLATQTNRFLVNIKQRVYRRLLTQEDYEAQQTLLAHWDVWARRGENFLITQTMSEKDLCAAKLLRIQLIINRIWLRHYVVPEECSYDESQADFDILLSLADLALAAPASEGTPAFLFDPDVLLPLYYTAIKCRNPDSRSRAVRLLQSLKRREGPWGSELAVVIASRVIELEGDGNMTDDMPLPTEEQRVHTVTLDCSVGKDGRHRVTYYTKPKGIDEAWRIWTESIDLP